MNNDTDRIKLLDYYMKSQEMRSITPWLGSRGMALLAFVLLNSPWSGSGTEYNIARNDAATGYPSPLESDPGWGGGSDPWQIVDGLTVYPSWPGGLAFTGGDNDWDGVPCGPRQATVDFGGNRTFHKVVVWQHGDDHVPAQTSLSVWDGAAWRDIAYSRDYSQGTAWSRADQYTFSPVTGSKVKWSINNCQTNIVGTQIVHGWIYEFEVFAETEAAPVSTRFLGFERLPDGSIPDEGMAVSNQFLVTFGVSFRQENGKFPRIAKRDSTGFVAFTGPSNPGGTRKNHPAPSQGVNNFFLSSNAGADADPPSPLVMTFSSPLAEVSGAIIDIDFEDAWAIEARDLNENIIAMMTLKTNSPNAGEGFATPWFIARTNADIYSVRIRYDGHSHPVGHAFDNLAIGLQMAPALLTLTKNSQGTQIGISGTFGRTYRVEWTSLLSPPNWQPLAAVTLTNAPEQSLFDSGSSNVVTRFYRAIGIP